MNRSGLGVALLLLGLLSGSPVAEAAPADDAPSAEMSTEETVDAEPAVADDEARGLQRKGVDPVDAALAAPRAVLFPAKLVLAGLFAPVRWGLRTFGSGSGNLPVPLYFDRARTIGVSPVLATRPGLNVMVGARLFHDDLGHGERIELSGAFGGVRQYQVGLQFGADRLGGSRFWTRAGVKVERIDNQFFSGIGSRGGHGAQYSQQRLLGVLGAGLSLGDQEKLQLGFTLIGNRRRFGDPGGKPQTSVRRFYDTRKELVGFEEGADTLEVDALVRFWGARVEGIRQTGPRLELFGGPVFSSLGGAFFHGGAEASWTIDLYGGNRLLTVRSFVETVEGPERAIPFTSLPRLGGVDRVRGYRDGRFRGRRALGGGLEYRYPVHEWLQSVLFFDVGTVSDSWGALTQARWHPGGGVGVLVGSTESVLFRADVAYGDGLAVTIATDVPLAFSGREEEL